MFKALREFKDRLFNHPWEQQTELIRVWLDHAIKTREQICGEYFCVYVDWLSKQLAQLGSIYALDEARYAVSMAIVRESSRQGKTQHISNVVIHHNLVFRLGDEAEAVKRIPPDCLRRLTKRRDLNADEFLPRLTKDAFEEIYRRAPLGVLENVSEQTFRGKNAYRFTRKGWLSNVNYKLPYPGQDVLHAHYFDSRWPRDLFVNDCSLRHSAPERGSVASSVPRSLSLSGRSLRRR
jgi:hypothetical protein